MRSLWLGILACAAMFVACGDDDSDFATRPGESSSSVCKDCDDESSSSDTPKSSDSETSVSSSSAKSSSSSAKANGSEYDAIANTLKDLRDGQTYRTVKIGDQVWMAENLNLETDKSFCYNDSVEYCDKYGRLYTWAAAMDSAGTWNTNGKGCGYGKACAPTYTFPVRGVCPDGWHLPSKAEWEELLDAVGDSSNVGKILKSTSGWRSGNGTDDFGFSVLPAGDGWLYNGTYEDEGVRVFYWISTERNSAYAYFIAFYNNSDGTYISRNRKDNEFMVRCVKDNPDSKSAKSSGIINLAIPCKIEEEDNCEYGELVDDRDGQTYKTVKIGDQEWMAESLNFETDSSFCYNLADSNCTKYGRLYSWAGAMDSAGTWSLNGKGCGYEVECSPTYPVRGVCPDGWHLPSKADAETLFVAVSGNVDNTSYSWPGVGAVLKSTSSWDDYDGESGNGTDDFGFSALPAGVRFDDGYGYNSYKGIRASYWSSTENSSIYAYSMDFSYRHGDADLLPGPENRWLPVRCVKD